MQLHHDADDVLFSDQPAIEHCESWRRHEQDERTTNQHPAVVSSECSIVHGRFKIDLGLFRGYRGRLAAYLGILLCSNQLWSQETRQENCYTEDQCSMTLHLTVPRFPPRSALKTRAS